jgi:hypothetical protein
MKGFRGGPGRVDGLGFAVSTSGDYYAAAVIDGIEYRSQAFATPEEAGDELARILLAILDCPGDVARCMASVMGGIAREIEREARESLANPAAAAAAKHRADDHWRRVALSALMWLLFLD